MMSSDSPRCVTQFGTCPDCGRRFRLTANRFGDLVIPGHFLEYERSGGKCVRCPGSFGLCAEDESGLGVLGHPWDTQKGMR